VDHLALVVSKIKRREGIRSDSSEKTQKTLTGIRGLDEITFGGLPRGRATLVCGGPGCGKTVLAMEFLVRGATKYDDPGVFVTFEETEEELRQNFRSLDFDIDKLEKSNKLVIDHVHIDRSEIEETGEYNLDGLFIRLANAIDSVGAKRVAVDTIEVLFGGLTNAAIVRSELRRLFRWLKDRGVTVIVTAEKGDANSLTRFGIEEYVADCVLVFDNRMKDQIAVRRLRILKYRGSVHGMNEYPYLIDEHGISLEAITSVGLNHEAHTERVSSGIEGLDVMMGGKGFFRGSSILVTGTAGTGKSTIAAEFAAAACKRGERALYFAFEESKDQILRNMRAVGLHLEPLIKKGLLQFYAERSSIYGLEMHLLTMFKRIQQFKPPTVIIDPITNLVQVGSETEVKSVLTRLIDFLKTNGITAMFTSLTSGRGEIEQTSVGISSLMDTWIMLRSQDTGGMRDHGIYFVKSRGMSHSTGIRQFRFTAEGIVLQ
jgi:circadian clock protein KaiC